MGRRPGTGNRRSFPETKLEASDNFVVGVAVTRFLHLCVGRRRGRGLGRLIDGSGVGHVAVGLHEVGPGGGLGGVVPQVGVAECLTRAATRHSVHVLDQFYLRSSASVNKTLGLNLCTADQNIIICLLYTSPSPRDVHKSRMPSSA